MSTLTLRSTLGFGRQTGGFRRNRPPRTDSDLLVRHARAFRQWRALVAVSGLLALGVAIAGMPLAEANGRNRFRHLPSSSAMPADAIRPAEATMLGAGTEATMLGAGSVAATNADEDIVVTMPTMFISAHPR